MYKYGKTIETTIKFYYNKTQEYFVISIELFKKIIKLILLLIRERGKLLKYMYYEAQKQQHQQLLKHFSNILTH